MWIVSHYLSMISSKFQGAGAATGMLGLTTNQGLPMTKKSRLARVNLRF